MLALCPKCGSAHVARDFDNDTKIDIALTCHDCGFEYSVYVVPEITLESNYDAERYDGPTFDVIPSIHRDDGQL